ncbi:hypothetical protein FDECE_951 [Fusarium decemcellulare]|nr:hypothetical protein FDECE_951 [Fusarium decemcellulare]
MERSSQQQPQAPPHRVIYVDRPNAIDTSGARYGLKGDYRNRRTQESDIEDLDDSALPTSEQEPDQDQEDKDGDADSKYRPIMQISINWRSEICRLLEISPDVSDEKIIEAMGIAHQKLREIDQLRSTEKARQGPPRFQIFHSPWVVETGPNNAHLRGSQPVRNLELYLERNKEIVFTVYRDYRCCGRSHSRTRSEPGMEAGDASSLLEREQISVISPVLQSAMMHLANSALKGIPYPDFGASRDINHPYLWWFHRRREIDEVMDKLRPESWLHVMQLLHDYILGRMMNDWETVGKLLERSKISAQYIDYLFVPGHIVISKLHGDTLEKLQGFVAQGWLETRTSNGNLSASLDVSSWGFDGKFHKTLKKLSIDALPSQTEEFSIVDLPIYPLEFVTDSIDQVLRKRGQMFWKCRFRKFVSYAREEEEDWIQSSAKLIQAVVANHVRTAENADLIQGKGNGLFILIHGGPGTGKTLTAESVAEITKKPLYRVACGDIGTKAENIETYVGVVLDVCDTWGCVVLLDEAEVFLEQRSLVNLERNEMVSTFLRMLEEYDGILILTSNRVGTFDEAFMSRIQLNLRYKNLDRNQRLQIWSNFLLRLERIETERVAVDASDTETQSHRVNVKEIKGKINELADANLNGRQIRNTISMARHLATYRKEPMAYKHFEFKLRATSWVFAKVEVNGAALAGIHRSQLQSRSESPPRNVLSLMNHAVDVEYLLGIHQTALNQSSFRTQILPLPCDLESSLFLPETSPSKVSKSNKLYRWYIGKQVIMTDSKASNNPRKVWHQGTLTMYKCRSCGKIYHQVYDPGFTANGNNSRGGFAFPNMAHRITNTDGLCPACADKEKEREKEKERAKERDKNKDKNEDKDEDKEKPKPST